LTPRFNRDTLYRILRDISSGGIMNILRSRRIRTILIYILAFGTLALILLIFSPADEPLRGSRLYILLGVMAVVFIPISLLAHKWGTMVEGREVMSLKEFDLGESELSEAVKLWVFSKKGQEPQGDIHVYFDDEGNLHCRYYLPLP
jgi:hypothetical protein